jgi:hypothetical protein
MRGLALHPLGFKESRLADIGRLAFASTDELIAGRPDHMVAHAGLLRTPDATGVHCVCSLSAPLPEA